MWSDGAMPCVELRPLNTSAIELEIGDAGKPTAAEPWDNTCLCRRWPRVRCPDLMWSKAEKEHENREVP